VTRNGRRTVGEVASVIGGFVVYVLAFFALEPGLAVDTAALMLVPVAVSGWCFGLVGGVASAVIALLLHSTLTATVLDHAAPFTRLAAPGVPTALVTVAFGVAVGLWRNRDRQLRAALERHRALEHELRANERHLEQIAANVLAGTYSIRKGRFTYVNAAFAAIFDFTPEEVVDRLVPADVVHPEDRAWVVDEVVDFQDIGDEIRRFRFRGLRRDGSVVPVEALEQVVTLEGERTLVGTLIDRTREEEGEARLRLQLTALQAAPVGIVVTDPSGLIEWANPHALGLTGYGEDELVGSHTRMLGSGRQDRAFYRSLWETVTAGRPWSGELINRRKDGSEYREAMNITPVIGPHGVIEHFVAAKRDVTEQALARENIRELNRDLRTQVQRLTTLRRIDTAITAGTDLRSAVGTFVEAAREGLGVDVAAAYVAAADGCELELLVVRGASFPAAARRLSADTSAAGRAILNGTPYLARGRQPIEGALGGDADANPLPFELLAAAPMLARGGLRGGLVVAHRGPLEVGTDWLEFLVTVATQGAILIDNAALVTDLAASNQELRAAYDATIEGWSRALDLRDKETEGHSRRVTELSLRLARAMGRPEEELVHIRRGALLHDIGKMGVPDAILQKPGALTDEEWARMRQHTVFAADLLAPIHFLKPALAIPAAHHERWDGSGYPMGLSGEAIPLAARIFAVADVYDALTSDRPYRPAWSHDEAIAHIRKETGRHFDPAVVDAFLALDEGGWAAHGVASGLSDAEDEKPRNES
jgi:PAS domain S-box-containing protein/putative nucleotidyltransferase with HDIG domain